LWFYSLPIVISSSSDALLLPGHQPGGFPYGMLQEPYVDDVANHLNTLIEQTVGAEAAV
jgi:hypothetical protein